jgi:superfamily II DNA or RNA helicase
MFDGFFPSQERKVLRPHQDEALRLVRSSLGKGNRRVVLQGPVGFGKTLVAARIIEGALAKGNSVVFTAPMISLIDQTVAAFETEGMDGLGVMQANHPRTDPLARVQVASVQTLARRGVPHAALVIVDECHLSGRGSSTS